MGSQTVPSVTAWGALINVVLAAVKVAVGLAGRSRALVADGIHSLSDLVTDIAVIAGWRAARRPADSSHAFGHGRYETISALFVGASLAAAGVAIAIHAGATIAEVVNGGQLEQPSWLAFGAAISSVAIKEALFHWTRRVGRAAGSPAAIANAWHHRSDAFSSIASAAGIAGAIVLAPQWRILDPLAAILVAVLVALVGVRTMHEALREMTDHALPREDVRMIATIVEAVAGADDPHNIRTRRLGSTAAIEVHFRVDGSISVDQGHGIACDVETRIRDHFGPDTRVITHVEPALPPRGRRGSAEGRR